MEEQGMSIRISEVFEAVNKRKNIIIFVTLLSVLITAVITIYFVKPTYEAEETVIVSKQANTEFSYDTVLMYQNMLKTYAAIAQNESVAQQTIDTLGLKVSAAALLSQVKVIPQTNTQIIELDFRSKNPEEAYKVAKEFTDNFIKKANELLPLATITVLDKADFPKKPVKPIVKLDIAIAFLLGLMISAVIIFLIEYNDNTIKTEEDIERYLNIPAIGIIPENVSK